MEKDIFDRMMSLPGLRKLYPFYEKHKEMLLYILFGGLTTVVSVGSFVLLDTVLEINELVANVISWILAVSFAYVTNRIWVFRSRATGKAVYKEAAAFYAGRLATLGIEEGALLVFVTWLSFDSTVVKVAAQVAVLVGNYLLSKFLIFKQK